jgi:geranylgeranyl diphosphate synthase, type II
VNDTGPTTATYVRARRTEVDAALSALLPASPRCPTLIARAMQYSVTAGGKRLRPVLCLASAEAVGGDRTLAMPAACAVELIHTYSLIHDDLPAMDNGSMRRGRPTLHVVAGEGMAILAGDGLLTEAFGVLARVTAGAGASAGVDVLARVLRVIDVIATAAGPVGMVGGQALDLACVTPDAEGRLPPPLDPRALAAMHAKKTGALIRGAAVAGAIMGGGDERQIAAIDAATAEFGLAFQIIDDVLDVSGTSAELGKTTGKDQAAGKPTYPSLYGVDESRRMAAACIDRAARTLEDVQLGASQLLGIGLWIVERSS